MALDVVITMMETNRNPPFPLTKVVGVCAFPREGKEEADGRRVGWLMHRVL